MPEGDVVWLTARRLHQALAGRVLTVSDFRVPALATADLRGRRVAEATARGKHLLVRVDGGLTVHTHLMMDGSWRIRPAGRPPRDHRIRLALGNDASLALGYSLAVVELLPTAEEARAVGHLGPDLLGPDWDPGEAVRRLLERPGRPVGEALLDQTRLAGIGNVYKCEVLFLRGVNPWRPVGDVDDLRVLVDLAQRLLHANRSRHGHVTTGDLRRGHEHWVYGRAGRPCRRCGTRIERAEGDRVTFWCPRCQPAPAGGSAPAR
ncbi:MAG TPA: DNA-formamidopyrimidine glycosylase family protein [Thermomonospora sp.]|nr:DNA-formamidopyrimidine glycosylase family protein [Thermomonospora sp.]